MHINYNGKYFPNATWAATKSQADFVEHEKHVGLTEAELKEAYDLCIAAVAPAETVAGTAKPRKQKDAEVV